MLFIDNDVQRRLLTIEDCINAQDVWPDASGSTIADRLWRSCLRRMDHKRLVKEV